MKTLIGLLIISYPALAADRPAQTAAFEAFSPQVKLRWDKSFLYVESNGLPAHNMMVGITSWQQQIPLPVSYFAATTSPERDPASIAFGKPNVWRLPLVPTPSANPIPISAGNFQCGAIAVGADGIAIFNPRNNRGAVSYEIGELDLMGLQGLVGRAAFAPTGGLF